MTMGGWITMIFSVGSVTILFVWCLYKVLFCNPPAPDVVEATLEDKPPQSRR